MISFFRKSSDNYFVVEHINEFSKKDIEKLSWLFSGSTLLKEKMTQELVLCAHAELSSLVEATRYKRHHAFDVFYVTKMVTK